MTFDVEFQESEDLSAVFESADQTFDAGFGDVLMVGTPGEGAHLPRVTEEDDGKVLKVHSGEWSVREDETARPLTNIEIENLLNNFT